jgi:hypothetical protein
VSPDNGKGYDRAEPLSTGEIADLERLGTALNERTADVVDGMIARTRASGGGLEASVEDSLVRVCGVATGGVARWIAGAEEEVARSVGRESWQLFAQLAVRRAAPLNEVAKRCLRWRDATEQTVRDIAADLEMPDSVVAEALAMVQRSLEVTLVRMCEAFEAELQAARAQLDRHQEELAYMATHDALTKLPNRTLILDRIEKMLPALDAARCRSPRCSSIWTA